MVWGDIHVEPQPLIQIAYILTVFGILNATKASNMIFIVLQYYTGLYEPVI